MSSSGIDRAFERRLAALVNAREPRVLQGGLKGVEKESLRVAGWPHRAARRIRARSAPRSRTAHHDRLLRGADRAGHAGVHGNWEPLQFLCDLHQFVYRHLDDELLWATSMPCIIDGDADIPIARFGRSNIGRMKTVYRRGLGCRYGRMMQAISGVHFNYSFPAHFWPVLVDDAAGARAGAGTSSPRSTSACCGTIAATAG